LEYFKTPGMIKKGLQKDPEAVYIGGLLAFGEIDRGVSDY
jgi:cytochrome c-type biogenesis protein CcmE